MIMDKRQDKNSEDSRRESRRATRQLHSAMQVEINGGGGGEKD